MTEQTHDQAYRRHLDALARAIDTDAALLYALRVRGALRQVIAERCSDCGTRDTHDHGLFCSYPSMETRVYYTSEGSR